MCSEYIMTSCILQCYMRCIQVVPRHIAVLDEPCSTVSHWKAANGVMARGAGRRGVAHLITVLPGCPWGTTMRCATPPYMHPWA
jgi:hypothetical protein